jgi:hypothetical protein
MSFVAPIPQKPAAPRPAIELHTKNRIASPHLTARNGIHFASIAMTAACDAQPFKKTKNVSFFP